MEIKKNNFNSAQVLSVLLFTVIIPKKKSDTEHEYPIAESETKFHRLVDPNDEYRCRKCKNYCIEHIGDW